MKRATPFFLLPLQPNSCYTRNMYEKEDDSVKKLAVPDKKICVACGVCRSACRKNAISIYKGCYAQVDDTQCVGCRLCAKACPAGCIAIQERSEVK